MREPELTLLERVLSHRGGQQTVRSGRGRGRGRGSGSPRDMEEEEEQEAVSILSRKELRKQKFMEYLAAKGKLKPPNPKPYLRDNCQVKKGKENKAPADRITNGGAKTLVAQPTKRTAATAASRKTFGDSNKVSVKANVLIGRQNADRPAQPRLNRIPAPTGRSTVLSSRCDPMNAAGRLKKQPSAGMPPSGRSHSSASRTAVTKPSGRFGSRAAGSCPPTPVSVRMSLGPMVKTKTGLIPAVTQPRNGPSQHLKPSSAVAEGPITSATAAKKTQSSSLPPVSVSRKPAVTQRKPLPTASLNHLERLRAGIKVPNQSKSNNSKPPLSRNIQPSAKIPLSSGPKSTAAPFKPQGRAAAQPTDRFTKQRSEGGGQKNSQPCKAAPRASSGPASSRGSRAVGGVPRAAVAEPGGKPATRNTRDEADGNKGRGSTKAPPTQTGMKRASAPGTSRAPPRPGRTIDRTGRPADAKTPKVSAEAVPPTEGKKLTAAQEERMRKLQEWREAKGISYKRPPMPVKPQVRRHTAAAPQPFWNAMNEEDEAQSLISAVDRSLEDCIKLLREGCPPGPVREVLARLPAVSKKFAKYWICQARLLEQEGHLDVLPMFEEAVSVVLEPVDELRAVVFEILKKRDEIHGLLEKEADRSPTCERTPESTDDPTATPKPVRALLRGEKGDSSVVKYKITATPGGPPRQQAEPARVNGQEVRFFTPVRRSVRIERSSLRYPASLQDHDLCVSSYGDLIHEEEDGGRGDEREAGGSSPMYVYRRNDALEDKVFVQLVYDDAV
ncbi:cytoskeleton-associated protein 2-like isoform X2 [Cyclopterus lumpus]|nr:cytoskeleton-associated protein 2-like isoform X2 [Cyclopterus lumpus]